MLRRSILAATAFLVPAAAVLLGAAALTSGGQANPFEGPPPGMPESRLDKLVFGRLDTLRIAPANLCSDAVFVRRVYLDVIGTLPSAAEAEDFIKDARPDKRQLLIDRLLERDEFADYWALKWSDLLRVKSEFPIDLWPNAVQAYHGWIRDSIKANKPYDVFVRELLTSSGSNFRVPQVNFYRALQSKDPTAIAQAVALTFMGTRTDNWPKERLAGMATFFAQVSYKSTDEWKEEIVFSDPAKTPPARATLPDGTAVAIPSGRDAREVLADWLVDPKNPWFARAITNRIWYWLLGRGIIQEPDDIRPDNPPVNPELLAYLESELVGAKYDLKHIFRLILNSKTYQLSSIPRSNDPRAEANFASYPVRRLEAEVLIDAIDQITGTTEKYSSPIPEPFTFIPENLRTITLADGSTSSAFLELFGRPARDTGLESERNNRPSAAQRLHLLNSTHIQNKIERSLVLGSFARPGDRPRDVVTRVYLTVLSRYPTDEELRTVGTYTKPGRNGGRELLVDLVWALVNNNEFLYRH